ncbi:MAG: hypothetical protein P9L99_18075 [Candidatus Lernaella stagnicola]|nr:hypothetical protein [Candidatus Lernaella stagnicola]
MTKPERILVAAIKLTSAAKADFSIEDLVVSCYMAFPSHFGLKGYESQYPDSNAVYVSMMGRKAVPIVRGWIEKIGTKRFRVTAKGFSEGGLLISDSERQTTKTNLSRDLDQGIGNLVTTHAYEEFSEQGNLENVTFYHFCRFVSLTARDKWQKVQGKISKVEHIIDEAVELGENGHEIRFQFRKRNIILSPNDLVRLGVLWKQMLSKFSTDLEKWKSMP